MTAMDQALVRQMRERVEQELSKKELETLGYWRGELEKTISKRHSTLAAFTNDVHNVMKRMDTRLGVLKRK